MMPGAYNSSIIHSCSLSARCNSSLPASTGCNTNTVTLWHSQVASHVASIDPNHLVTSG